MSFWENKRYKWLTWFTCFKAIYSGNTLRACLHNIETIYSKNWFRHNQQRLRHRKNARPKKIQTFPGSHFSIIILLQIIEDFKSCYNRLFSQWGVCLLLRLKNI